MNETWVVIQETCRICGKNLAIVCTEHAADFGYAEVLIDPLCQEHRGAAE